MLAAEGVRPSPATLGAALADVDRLLLVSSSQVGQLVAQHTNVITAAMAAVISWCPVEREGSAPRLRPDDHAVEPVAPGAAGRVA